MRVRSCANRSGEILATPRHTAGDSGISPRPFLILMVGVNGSGKTTTIGKLARRLRDQGLKVMLAAGDTYRAAAIEQLQVWGERNDVPVITQQAGADPAAVIYDAFEAARARGIDVLLADTAGRLQNKAHLMQELQKVVRIAQAARPDRTARGDDRARCQPGTERRIPGPAVSCRNRPDRESP
jgi:fused signal recognition particle receptor